MNLKKFVPLVGIIILIYIIVSLDHSTIIQIFLSLNPIYVFLAFFAIIPVLLLENIEWQILLKRQKINVSFFSSFKNLFIGFFYGFITPGGIGGYVRAVYLRHESNAPLPKCVSSIITVNTIDYMGLLLFGATGALLISGRYPYLFVTIVICLLIILVLFSYFLKKRASQVLFYKIIQTRVFQILQKKLNDPFESFYEDLPRFRDVLIPFSLSLLGWFMSFSEFYVISRLFSIDVPYFSVLFFIAIASVVTALPISIYGLGTRELTLLSLFSLYPVLPAAVLSLSLFWFVITWLFPSIIGAILAVFEHNKFSPFHREKKKNST